jgi:quercetin dioxygenase-like cupin family protein
VQRSSARVNNVNALDVAFLDQRIPRYERDIINMVGMGVTENAALMPNVNEGAVAFSVTYVRAKSGKGAALHRHATEEVFIPVKGRWQIFWLEGEEERTIDLDEGDVVNVPIGVYRGFRSLTDAPDALLMAIIGGPDAGKVDWHPSVLEEARKSEDTYALAIVFSMILSLIASAIGLLPGGLVRSLNKPVIPASTQ